MRPKTPTSLLSTRKYIFCWCLQRDCESRNKTHSRLTSHAQKCVWREIYHTCTVKYAPLALVDCREKDQKILLNFKLKLYDDAMPAPPRPASSRTRPRLGGSRTTPPTRARAGHGSGRAFFWIKRERSLVDTQDLGLIWLVGLLTNFRTIETNKIQP